MPGRDGRVGGTFSFRNVASPKIQAYGLPGREPPIALDWNVTIGLPEVFAEAEVGVMRGEHVDGRLVALCNTHLAGERIRLHVDAPRTS